VHAHGSRFYKALVLTIAPADLTVELSANDVVIEADHLLLGAWPRWFDKVYGLKKGDTLIVTPLDDGDWFVFDVISQSDLDGMLVTDDPQYTSISVDWEGGNHVAAKAPYHDAETGALIGYVPIMSTIADMPVDV
jgi:hypothetical protein